MEELRILNARRSAPCRLLLGNRHDDMGQEALRAGIRRLSRQDLQPAGNSVQTRLGNRKRGAQRRRLRRPPLEHTCVARQPQRGRLRASGQKHTSDPRTVCRRMESL